MIPQEMRNAITDKIDAFFGPCKKKKATVRLSAHKLGGARDGVLSVLEANGKAAMIQTRLWFKKGQVVRSEVVGFVPLVG